MKKDKEMYLTAEGLEEIKKELDVLKLEKRTEIISGYFGFWGILLW